MDEPVLFQRWMANLEARHLADLRVSEVARALRALSSAYVERRDHALAGGRALDGAGKRAAFALYYGPLHYQLIRHVTQELAVALPSSGVVVDLGCGTGVAAAAIAAGGRRAVPVFAVDSQPWAVDEARHTYRAFDLDATVKRGDVLRTRPPHSVAMVVAAFVVNELNAAARHALLPRLLDLARGGAPVLVV